ncbi:Ribonuclease H-like superfamily [Sesbania bispinosa]|nr:Ribonuclease H-like superfamily [Sesbania bispinosa]
MHDSLPVRTNLLRRNIPCTTSCPWCDDEEETTLHLFRDCAWTVNVWSQSPLGIQPLSYNANSAGEWINEILNNASEEHTSIFFALCYEIWHARNKKIFEHHEANIQTMILRAMKANLSTDRSAILNDSRHPISAPHVVKWYPPPNDFFKINVDVAHAVDDMWGIGVIIRNSSGEVLAAATRQTTTFMDPGLAEALGVRIAIEFAKDMYFDKVILQSDCKYVTDMFSSSHLAHSYIGMLVQDCLSLASSFNNFQVMHTRRDGNMCAHHLAKYACSYPDNNWIEVLLLVLLLQLPWMFVLGLINSISCFKRKKKKL